MQSLFLLSSNIHTHTHTMMMEIPHDDLRWKMRAKRSKLTSPPPPPKDLDEEEIAAAEALVLLANCGGGFCDSSAPTTIISPKKRQELPLLAAVAAVEIQSAAAVKAKNQEQTPPDTPLRLKYHPCFVCGQVFHSFQALGGHMTSHRAKTESAADIGRRSSVAPSGRVHECSYCYETFATGQALGGHKRKHYEGPVLPRKAVKFTSNGGVPGETSPGGGDTSHDTPMLDLNFPPPLEEE